MNKETYTRKVYDFLHEHHIIKIHKDPTENYRKQTQQAIQICNILIDKQKSKFLTQIKPQPPTLNAQIKIHKENETIRDGNLFAKTYVGVVNTSYTC
jgi:hypothetical protein